MDKRAAIETSDKRSKESLKAQIAFTEKEREREHELIWIDGAASLLLFASAICLIVFKTQLDLHEFIFWLGLICAFLLSAFTLFLSFSHINKEKEKKILITKLKEEIKSL